MGEVEVINSGFASSHITSRADGSWWRKCRVNASVRGVLSASDSAEEITAPHYF